MVRADRYGGLPAGLAGSSAAMDATMDAIYDSLRSMIQWGKQTYSGPKVNPLIH